LRCEPEDEWKVVSFKYELVDGQIPIASHVGFEVAFFATKNAVGNAEGSVKPFQSIYRNSRSANEERLSPGATPAQADHVSVREAAKKVAVTLGIPLPTNTWLRLILSLQLKTFVRRLFDLLLDHATKPKAWQPLWLNMYLFNRGRGRNIRHIATYRASGDIRLLSSKGLPPGE
jgi:hypothetical protein